MIKNALLFRRLGLKLALLALLALPDLAGAQYFVYQTTVGYTLAGFRRAPFTSASEMVSQLGNVTNLLLLPPGTTITITNFNASQLTDALGNYNNVQWSVFSSIYLSGITATWKTPLGTYPKGSMWLTVPNGTNLTTQTSPPSRNSQNTQANQVSPMLAVGSDAVQDSSLFSESPYNTNTVVVEPESANYSQYDLTTSIGDANNNSDGDFGSGGSALAYSVENITPASFSAAQRSDFYQLVPSDKVDPITGFSGSTPYFVGYFIFNPNGTMTFTRPTTSSGPITASVTNGIGPVVLSSASTGSITNWVWNYGNGTSVTNTTGASETYTYTTPGVYAVTLTVYGYGGPSTTTKTIVAWTGTPQINFATKSGKLVLSGANCPPTAQYRILTTTNLLTALPSWKPVYTNTFLGNGTFSYTNSLVGTDSFFTLLSP